MYWSVSQTVCPAPVALARASHARTLINVNPFLCLCVPACLSHKHSYVTYDNLTSFLVKHHEQSPLVFQINQTVIEFRETRGFSAKFHCHLAVISRFTENNVAVKREICARTATEVKHDLIHNSLPLLWSFSGGGGVLIMIFSLFLTNILISKVYWCTPFYLLSQYGPLCVGCCVTKPIYWVESFLVCLLYLSMYLDYQVITSDNDSDCIIYQINLSKFLYLLDSIQTLMCFADITLH